MKKTMNVRSTSQLLFVPLLVGCVLLTSGCDTKDANAIKIEDQVVSTSGRADEKAAVEAFLQEKKEEVQKLSKKLSADRKSVV